MPRELRPRGTTAAYMRDGNAPGGEPRARPVAAVHGTRAKYEGGCRCEQCRQAHRAAHAQWRQAVAARPFEDVPHGSGGYKNWGCRCETCTAANSEASRARRARAAAARAKAPT